ncbi:MAG: outer membrane beta-barrel protein [Chlamydiia bacterium]|nr:outer membrane beta-barrel protein [Chlamydiia bacterium]
MKKLVLFLAASACLLADAPNPDFYVSTFGGVNWLEQTLQSNVKTAYKTDALGAISLGCKTGQGLCSRMELEGSFRRNPLEYIRDKKRVKHEIKGLTETRSVFINTYYDFKVLSQMTIFLGIGSGYTFMKLDIAKNKIKAKDKKEGMSLQYIAGTKTPLSEHIDIGAEWRFFIARGDYREQNIDLFLTYNF